jgi:hypothetical protein
VFLANLEKSDKYAQAWEARNPGKPFDPEDDEHNEFFASIKQPYTPQELRRAEASMVARAETERVAATRDEKTSAELKEIKSENARLKLAPKVNSTMAQAIGFMANQMGDDIVSILNSGGAQKLQEVDPEADSAIREAIGDVSPLIQAIVEIEESGGTVEYDKKNPAHRRYFEILAAKEEEYAGAVDERGRSCVSRAEYAQMSPAQRAQHYFLTPENIIAEVVSEQAQKTKQRIDEERNRIRKAAERMGFVPAKAAAANGNAAHAATPAKDPPKDLGTPAPIKPVSPSAGSGVKIDVKEPNPPTSVDAILNKVSGVLFGR